MYKLDFEKAQEPKIKLSTYNWIIEKAREFMKNIYLYSLTTVKPFTVWITTNCGKFLKRWEYQTNKPSSCKICVQEKNQQLKPDREQWTGSKLGKQYIKAVYCHLAYLTYMQNTFANTRLVEAPAGIKIPREIPITSDMQMTPSLWQKVKRN